MEETSQPGRPRDEDQFDRWKRVAAECADIERSQVVLFSTHLTTRHHHHLALPSDVGITTLTSVFVPRRQRSHRVGSNIGGGGCKCCIRTALSSLRVEDDTIGRVDHGQLGCWHDGYHHSDDLG